jgi:hypothetical protein
VVRCLEPASRWNTVVSMAASAAAVIWLRPPWTEVPTSWHALRTRCGCLQRRLR